MNLLREGVWMKMTLAPFSFTRHVAHTFDNIYRLLLMLFAFHFLGYNKKSGNLYYSRLSIVLGEKYMCIFSTF